MTKKAKAPARTRKVMPATRKSAARPAPRGADPVAQHIAAIGGWRGASLATIRRLIRETDPAVDEEMKWAKPTNPAGVPVWSHAGILCTGETYKDKVKLTFMRGAALPDPHGLFNAGKAGGARRAIDLREGDALDPNAFEALIRAAIALNKSRAGKREKA